MKEKLLEDLNGEVKTLEETLKKARENSLEIEKAANNVNREILVLEGRLAEVKAIVEHINSMGEDSETKSLEG